MSFLLLFQVGLAAAATPPSVDQTAILLAVSAINLASACANWATLGQLVALVCAFFLFFLFRLG
jgi:hypothetical protein